MQKHAVITCGFPRCGKTAYYQSVYKEYSYFNVDIPFRGNLDELKELTDTKKNIYLEGRNPRAKSRILYAQFLKNRGYSITYLWFMAPFEGILAHSYDILNFQEKQQFLSQAHSFKNSFEPPTDREPYTVLEKIYPKPEITKYGDSKALFLPLIGMFVRFAQRPKELKKYDKFQILSSQFAKIVQEYFDDGYKVIFVPSKMPPYVEESEIIKESKLILKKMEIPFTDIVFDNKNGRQIGIIRIAYPEVIAKASKKHSINLENSIMVGTDEFEKALSIMSGCGYYFSKDIFFEANEYVKMTLRGETNEYRKY